MKRISYNSLLESKSGQVISYGEKLITLEWGEKRNKILKRDKCTCDRCKLQATIFERGTMYREKSSEEIQEFKRYVANSFYDSVLPEFTDEYERDTLPPIFKNLIIKPEPIILQVHHKYYILDNLPWDYPDDALITVCNKCHQTIHDESEIPVYADSSMQVNLGYTKCSTCNGSGYRPEYHYYMNGVCFSCNGNRYIELK